MALNKVQRYLSILFFTSLIFTQALIYVAVKAANNNELLQAVYVEPVTNNLEIGDSLYFQAMLSSKDTSDFDYVSFNLQNPQTGLDENYQASLSNDGTWKAQSIWDTTYNYQPGQYYLSVVAYNYDGDNTTIYSSDYSLINLNGEFQAAAVTGDFGYFVSPVDGVNINPLNNSARMMLIDFRLEASASEAYIQRIDFNIEDLAGVYSPNFYSATRGAVDNGYEVWSAVVDTNAYGDGDYSIYANIVLTDAANTPLEVRDEINAIDNRVNFTIDRNTLDPNPINTSSVNVISPQDSATISTNTFQIDVEPDNPLSSDQTITAILTYRGTDITVANHTYILENSVSNPSHYVKSVDLGEAIFVDNGGSQGINLTDTFPNGDYSLSFNLTDSSSSQPVNLGEVNFTLFRVAQTVTTPRVTIDNPSLGEQIVGDSLLLQLTTNFNPNVIEVHLLPENQEELALDLELPVLSTTNSFQTNISASAHSFINGNYLLSVVARDAGTNVASMGPITFYWQVTDADNTVDPDLLSYQPNTSTIGPGDILIGSANVANVQFKLANASDATQASYTLSGVTNISCTNSSILGSNFNALKPASHNFCFYASISDSLANQLNNRGNYNFYLEHLNNGVSYTSPPVLITYYNDADQDTAPDQEFVFLRPQNDSTISNEFYVVIASNIDYATGLEVSLVNINDGSNSNYLSASRSSWAQASSRFGLNQVNYPNLAFVYISNSIDSKLFNNGRYDLEIVTDRSNSVQISINNIVNTNTPPPGEGDDGSEDNGEDSGNDNGDSTTDGTPIDTNNTPIFTQPVVTAPINVNNLGINLDTTCVEQGISDEQSCQRFQATIESLDQNCVAQNIYDEQACEDYLYRIKIDSECQANGIIDREECKNYLLEQYGAQVDCRLGDINLCNSVLRNRYLSRLVVGQKLSDSITKAVDPLIGKNISTKELSDTLVREGVDSKTILPVVANDETKVLVARAQKETLLEEENELTILNQAVIILDTDGDGLSDDLEDYYGTDSNNPDTDGDGYSDGTEINNGYDPAGPGKLVKERTNLDKILLNGDNVLEQPKTRSIKIDGDFKVDTVDAEDKKVKLYGQAEANTWVTLYLYSDLPLVMTTKTDASGNWSYDIKHSLTDGHHKVYVTVNDDTGKIVKQSRPISFLIREAQAVTVDDYFDESTVTQEVNNLFIYYILGGAFLVFLALGILIFIHKDKHQNLEV